VKGSSKYNIKFIMIQSNLIKSLNPQAIPNPCLSNEEKKY
jgi:hypothetical protein